MPYDDEFELNNSDFDDDLSPLQQKIKDKKLEIIKRIEEYTALAKDNIKFDETSDFDVNFKILSRYISEMVDLNQLESEEGIPDEEIEERLQEIERSVTEISVKDLRSVEEDDEEGAKLSLDELNKPDENDGSTDW